MNSTPVITLQFIATKEIAWAVAKYFLANQDVSRVRVEYQRPDGIWTWEEEGGDPTPN